MRHQQALEAGQVAGDREHVVQVDADGQLALVSGDEPIEAGVASGGVRIGRRVAAEVVERVDRAGDRKAVLLARVLHDHPPLVAEPLRGDLLFLEIRPGKDCIEVHPHGELFHRAAGADGLADFAVDDPFEMGNAIGLFAPQCPQDALGGSEFAHGRVLVG